MFYLGNTPVTSVYLGNTSVNLRQKEFLLDKYPALAGYSVSRTLKKNQTKIFRGRIDGIGPAETLEMDFGPDANGDLDEVAVAEFGGYNLLAYSQELAQISYNQVNILIISDVEISVLTGLQTVDKLLENTATGFHRLFTTSFFVDSGLNYNLSVHAKAAERTIINLVAGGTHFNFKIASFDLITGTTVNGNIIDLGNGWYRCSLSTSSVSTGPGRFDIELNDAFGQRDYVGDGISGVFISEVQVTQGNDLLDYQSRINGASDVFVTTLYDASGNDYDATQSNALSQPKIYDLVTKSVIKENGKPAILWPDSLNNNRLAANVGSLSIGDVFAVVNSSRTATFDEFLGIITAFNPVNSDDSGIVIVGKKNLSNWYSVNKIWDDLRQNGAALTSLYPAFPVIQNQTLINTNQPTIKTLNGLCIGSDRRIENRGWQGTIQEVIVFDSSQSTNRTVIENNINNYYGVY